MNNKLGGLTNETYKLLMESGDSLLIKDEIAIFRQILRTIKTILSIPKNKFQVVCRQIAMVERVWMSWEIDTILVAETLGAMVRQESDSIATLIN